MKTSKRAAISLGGFVERPPVSRKWLAAHWSQPIPDALWQSVEEAFAKYGRDLRALETSKMSRNKNDPESWAVRQAASTRAIENAITHLHRALNDHGEFLTEASANYGLQEYGRTFLAEHNARGLIKEALSPLHHAAAIVERAQPIENETPSQAEAKRQLVQRIEHALRAHGYDTRLSDGRSLPDDAAEIDLTVFERFISGLGIHDATTPSAFARWLRDALREKIGG